MENFPFTEGAFTVACDGLNATRMAMYQNTSFPSKSNQFEMLYAIDAKISKSPLQWNWKHMKGHQDDYF